MWKWWFFQWKFLEDFDFGSTILVDKSLFGKDNGQFDQILMCFFRKMTCK